MKADVSQNIEVRNYDSMILVSTDMVGDGRNSAFRKLFRYIDGENEAAAAIAMTALVFMNNRPGGSMMSFVMPKVFTPQTPPKPTNPNLVVTEVKDYKKATASK